ncbi:MAG: hypothetical protein ABI388_11765, partial [Bacteroidia bacterium]
MNTRPSNLAYIILILLIVVVIYLLYLVSKLGTFIREANPTVITACIGGFFTITLSIVSVFIGRYLEKKKMIEAEIRNKKIPVYEDFIKG